MVAAAADAGATTTAAAKGLVTAVMTRGSSSSSQKDIEEKAADDDFVDEDAAGAGALLAALEFATSRAACVRIRLALARGVLGSLDAGGPSRASRFKRRALIEGARGLARLAVAVDDGGLALSLIHI